MSEINERQRIDNPGTVLHWYDFLCPFCYVGQHRNAILAADGSAAAAVREAEAIGRKYGVQGTPAWLLDHRLITGLLPAAEFESLAEYATQLPR